MTHILMQCCLLDSDMGQFSFKHVQMRSGVLMKDHEFLGLWNYIDNLIYTGLPSEIYDSFLFYIRFVQIIGSSSKC